MGPFTLQRPKTPKAKKLTQNVNAETDAAFEAAKLKAAESIKRLKEAPDYQELTAREEATMRAAMRRMK